MSGLGDMFEETICTPPPSRLRADQVYAAGRRRRRWRMAAGASALTVAAATAGVVGVTTLTAAGPGSDPNRPPATGIAASGHATPDKQLEPRQIIQWSGAADRDHLYLSHFACLGGDCGQSKSTVRLMGSDDGGRSWTQRSRAINVINLTVLGPDTLLAAARTDAPNRPGQRNSSGQQDGPGQQDVSGQADGSTGPAADGPAGGTGGETPYALHVSTDGGRTWSAALRPPPVSRVPPGGAIICWSERETASFCSPYVFDPANRTLAPLAAQPVAIMGQVGDLLARLPDSPRAQAPLWLAGTDLVTGRPTTAVSTDRGRTWSLRELPGLPRCPATGCTPPELASGDERTVYAVANTLKQRLVYRSSDAAGWQRVPGADAVPYGGPASIATSHVTADGRHVLCELVSGERNGFTGAGTVDDLDRCRFWMAPAGGGAYRPTELAGLPTTVYPIRRAPNGWYYTHSYGTNGLYGSTDGRRWTPLSTPDR